MVKSKIVVLKKNENTQWTPPIRQFVSWKFQVPSLYFATNLNSNHEHSGEQILDE